MHRPDAPSARAWFRQEEFVARAKRTDRTEARRRFRAEQAALGDDQSTMSETGDPGSGPSKTKPAAPVRPGIGASFKAAYRPVNILADLRAAPQVLTHWGFIVAIVGAAAASVVYVLATSEVGAALDFSLSDPLAGKQVGTASQISYFAVSMFVTPPPAAGAFLIGFTAKRASWLAGLVYGVFAAACYIYILSSPAGRLLTGNNPAEVYIAQAAALAPIGAALFAAAAAWYRRFLDVANPNRGQRRPSTPSGRGNPRQKNRPLVSRAADKRR
jgi:hypothetical protein